VPRLFEWSQLTEAVEAGNCFVTCDDISHVRVDALVPELIPREVHLSLSTADWSLLESQEYENEWSERSSTLTSAHPFHKVLVRTHSTRVTSDSLLAAIRDHIKRIAWLSGNVLMRQHVLRIIGIYVPDKRKADDDQVKIGIVTERPLQGMTLSHYLDSIFEEKDPLRAWTSKARLAVHLGRAVLFFSRLSPPFLLGNQLSVSNIVLECTQDDLLPKFVGTVGSFPGDAEGSSKFHREEQGFGHLLMTIFIGRSKAAPHQPYSTLAEAESNRIEYPSWSKAPEEWRSKIRTIAWACLQGDNNQRSFSFDWVCQKLARLQRTLEPSRQILISKNFRMVKRVSAITSDAIQCLALFRQGGSMSTGVDKGSVWAGCSDGSLWIFDVSSEELLYSKLAHAKRVLCIMAVPDKDSAKGTVWTSSVDQTIKIWKAKEGKMIGVLGGFNEEICSMRPIHGKAWCGCLSGKIYIWDIRDLSCRMVHEVGNVPIWSIIEHQGKVWAALGITIVRFDATTFSQVDQLKGHTKPITCLLSVGDEVWSGGQDNTIRVWRGSDGALTHTLSKHSQKVYSLLSPYDGCVWSGSWDKTIIVWNTSSKEPMQMLQDTHDDAISALVSIEGTSPRVWSASWDKSLCIWE